MKSTLIAAALAALPVAALQAATLTIDPAHTYPNFRINHLGFSSMYGRFGTTSGTLELDPQAKRAAVEITIDAASVDTGHQKRDDHLRSPDFLNVAEYPTITFKSTAVTWKGDRPATVSGDLTILGVTRPVTLEVHSMNCGPHPFSKKFTCGFDARTTIKRTDFGVEYGVPAIGEEMELMLQVEASEG